MADPAQRITLPEILKHPWYLQALPPGVAEMNEELIAASEECPEDGQVREPLRSFALSILVFLGPVSLT